MSDFNQSEYHSYVALCRTMRFEHDEWQGLKHEFRHGDAFTYNKVRAGFEGESSLYDEEEEHEFVGAMVWLPTLSDWLELIQAEGASGFVVWKRPEGWDCKPVNGPMIDYDLPSFDVPTAEEAAARLWMVYKLHERDI
jgi:hypothetical protein